MVDMWSTTGGEGQWINKTFTKETKVNPGHYVTLLMYFSIALDK